MKNKLAQISLVKLQKFTWELIQADNVINWVVGVSLLLVPDFFNKVFFGHELISHWIYIVIGLGLLWFAIWQVDNFIKTRKLDIPQLRFSAFLAWGPCLLLTVILISGLGSQMLLLAQIFLWIVDIYMLLLGSLYWWLAERLKLQSPSGEDALAR